MSLTALAMTAYSISLAMTKRKVRASFRGSNSDRGNLPLSSDRLPRLVIKPRNDANS